MFFGGRAPVGSDSFSPSVLLLLLLLLQHGGRDGDAGETARAHGGALEEGERGDLMTDRERSGGEPLAPPGASRAARAAVDRAPPRWRARRRPICSHGSTSGGHADRGPLAAERVRRPPPATPHSSRPRPAHSRARPGGFTSKLEPRALEAAQHASKLQAELTALLHAADEAAAAANTKLVIQRAEAAAAEKRHAEALEAHQAEMEGARAEIAGLKAEVAEARDESAGLRRELAAKEDEYALELQRWVVDLSASHSQKVVDAVAAERDKASREEQRREEALRDEYEARIRGLEEQLAAAERGGGRHSGPRAGDQFVNAADPQRWDC